MDVRSAVALWALMIFLFSHVPHLESGLPQDFVLRKIAHMAEFAILAFLVWRALLVRRQDRLFLRITACLLALAYAGSDEVHQLFIPGREGSLRDIMIDGGGILAWLFLSLWRPSRFLGRLSPLHRS